nr:Rho termination factor N-terminal domain-containing protein [Blautia sp. NSJ-175]
MCICDCGWRYGNIKSACPVKIQSGGIKRRTVPAANNSTVYDDSYTVVQLKEAAKEQGITGYGSMSKQQLLEVLNNE